MVIRYMLDTDAQQNRTNTQILGLKEYHRQTEELLQATIKERDWYVYNYRIYDKFRFPVVSLAVLTDERPKWRPASFGYKRWGFRLEMEFPMTKLLDYNDVAKLENNPNPFAIVVMAHLKVLETRHTPHKRFEWKWHLTMALYERGYEKQDVLHLFQFID